MTGFFRFPHTPHLAWLGQGKPRDDKLLHEDEVARLLASDVVVEEKIDGANLGFSVDEDGALRCQNRGGHLSLQGGHPQFRPLWAWLEPRRSGLADALWPDLMLFGEWCVATHSVHYDALPDWFLGFDVFDRNQRRFWNAARRNALLRKVNLHPVPRIARGAFGVNELVRMVGTSRVGHEPMEGLVVRRDEGGWTTARAKLVRPEFAGAIGEHWSRRPLRRNALAPRANPWR